MLNSKGEADEALGGLQLFCEPLALQSANLTLISGLWPLSASGSGINQDSGFESLGRTYLSDVA